MKPYVFFFLFVCFFVAGDYKITEFCDLVDNSVIFSCYNVLFFYLQFAKPALSLLPELAM